MSFTEKQAKQLQNSLPAEKFDSIQYYWNHLSEEHQYEAEDFPCYQKLSIWLVSEKLSEEVSQEVTNALWDTVEGTLCFANVVPVPTELVSSTAGTDADADAWFYQNWGTRYEPIPDSVSYNNTDGRIDIYFTTALLPADAWVKALASRFPDLNFSLHYAETGNLVSGYWCRYKGGYTAGEAFDHIKPATWLNVGQDTDSYFTHAIGCPFTLFEVLDEEDDVAETPSAFLNALLEFDLDSFLYEDGYNEGQDDPSQSPQALEDLIRFHPNFEEDDDLEAGWREPLDPVWMK